MKDRDFYLDNAKFILIFLVVLGHYCGNYLNSHFLVGVYDSIYSFHMPAFILLSGFLSKNIKQQRYKDIDTILIPYFIIQLIYILYRKFLGMDQTWSFATPIDANWYLLGLFIWRLIIPYFNYIKFPIATSIVLSLAIGFLNDFGHYLDLERIITFFPYFVIGYFLPSNYKEFIAKHKFETKNLPYILLGTIFILFIAVAFIFPGKGSFIRKCFIPESGYYIWFGKYADFGIIIRAFSYFCSLFIAYLFFIVVPNRKTWYSELGTRTINVYLFHLMFLYLIGKYTPYHKFYSEYYAIPVAAGLSLILSSKLVAPFFEWILNFHNMLFKGIPRSKHAIENWMHLGRGLKHAS